MNSENFKSIVNQLPKQPRSKSSGRYKMPAHHFLLLEGAPDISTSRTRNYWYYYCGDYIHREPHQPSSKFQSVPLLLSLLYLEHNIQLNRYPSEHIATSHSSKDEVSGPFVIWRDNDIYDLPLCSYQRGLYVLQFIGPNISKSFL